MMQATEQAQQDEQMIHLVVSRLGNGYSIDDTSPVGDWWAIESPTVYDDGTHVLVEVFRRGAFLKVKGKDCGSMSSFTHDDMLHHDHIVACDILAIEKNCIKHQTRKGTPCRR